jgi:iron complex transport system ATP-binding protein
MTAPAVSATNLTIQLGGAPILRGVDVIAPTGGWTTIIGPNGAGKTTALRIIGGLAQPAAGTVELFGEDAQTLGVRARARLVASMPQNPVIPPRIRVVDYVLLGRTAHLGTALRPGPADLAVVEETMVQVDLEGFGGRRVDELSGGERQRVVVARSLAQQAPVLLLDEPTTALDIGHQQEVLETVDRIRVETGVTVLATSHDLALAGQYSHHLILLVDGLVRAKGSAHEVLRQDVLSEAYNADLEVSHEDGEIFVVPRRRKRP